MLYDEGSLDSKSKNLGTPPVSPRIPEDTREQTLRRTGVLQ